MKITLKLYASLTDCLPVHAKQNKAEIDINPDSTLHNIIDEYHVPRELAHLVLLNGVFICHEDRDAAGFIKENDVLAIWPPVAGG